jgi:hypothetical protein
MFTVKKFLTGFWSPVENLEEQAFRHHLPLKPLVYPHLGGSIVKKRLFINKKRTFSCKTLDKWALYDYVCSK